VFIAAPILIYLGVGTSRPYAASESDEITMESPPTVPSRTPAPAAR
jgi:hypothetical protein